MVSYYVTFVVTVYGEFFGEPNSSSHEMSGGFISLHARPHKSHVLWTFIKKECLKAFIREDLQQRVRSS